MAERLLRPDGKGFLFLDSHPAGCAAAVADLAREARTAAPPGGGRDGPAALIIGCSAGYGLAAAVTGLFGYRARVAGLGYERPATARRSASAGWYRVAALADLARTAGLHFDAVNGDCFEPSVRAAMLDRVAATLGPVDVLIYSVAAPRRTDPVTGVLHRSAVKPIGAPYTARSIAFADGPVVREPTLEPANDAEIASTIAVMGGADWADWVADLASRGLLARGFTTVALSYVGSPLTAPIYRHGTIGRAKEHLEATASDLGRLLARLAAAR